MRKEGNSLHFHEEAKVETKRLKLSFGREAFDWLRIQKMKTTALLKRGSLDVFRTTRFADNFNLNRIRA